MSTPDLTYDPSWKPEGGPDLGYDPDWKPEASNPLRRFVADPAISLLKGVVGVPEAAVGLADIVTGGHAGKFLENAEGDFGFRPKEAKNMLDSYYSPEQKAANEHVQNADGFIDTLGRIADKPSVIPHAILESLPVMGAGGVVSRSIAPLLESAAIRGAIGEGVIGAGSAAEQVRQETKDGLMTLKQGALPVASGAGTFAFGALGGKLSNRLGIGDVENMLAGGAQKIGKKGMARSAAEGFITEGGFEEAPQSAWEQAMQNIALDRPWYDGVGNAAALGAVTGGVMGAGAGGIGSLSNRDNAAPGRNPLTQIAGLLPAPVQTGMEGHDILLQDVARQNSMDAAQANADKIYAERDAYEAAMAAAFPYGLPQITEPVASVQEKIDEALRIDQSRLSPQEQANYVKTLKALLDTPVGITNDANGHEIPLTMGALLNSQATVETVLREQRSQQVVDNATEQAQARNEQVASEESSIPVVGPLSAAGDMAVKNGAAQVAAQATEPAPEPPAPPVYQTGSEEKAGTYGDGGTGKVVVKHNGDGGFHITTTWDQGIHKKSTGSSFPAGTDVNEAIAQMAAAHGGFAAETAENAREPESKTPPATEQPTLPPESSANPAVAPQQAQKGPGLSTPIKSYAKKIAMSVASMMTRNGSPTEAYPHPSGDGTYALRVPGSGSEATPKKAETNADKEPAKKEESQVTPPAPPGNNPGEGSEDAQTTQAEPASIDEESKKGFVKLGLNSDGSEIYGNAAGSRQRRSNGFVTGEMSRAGGEDGPPTNERYQTIDEAANEAATSPQNDTPLPTAETPKTEAPPPKTLPERVDAAKEKAATEKADKKAVAKHVKTFERELSASVRADSALVDLAGTSGLEEFTQGAEKAAIARIEDLKKSADTPEAKAALAALVVDGKPVLPKVFFESAHVAMKKAWEAQQKEAARDPELYKETLRWGMSVKNIDEGSDEAAKYKTGFDHALRGQTKSTLPNDSTTYLDGYKDARAWVATDGGRAWFDGKRIEKQKNTGVVLRRWWERKMKDVNALTKTDKEAWDTLLKATSRAELFPQSTINEEATPGAKAALELLRANLATFQEFFWHEGTRTNKWGNRRYSRKPFDIFQGSATYTFSKDARYIDGLSEDERLDIAKEIAAEYKDKLSAFAEKFSEAKTLDDIEAVTDALFFPDGRKDDNGKHLSWTKSDYFQANASLFVANASSLSGMIPVFDVESLSAKHNKWTSLRATEDVERQGKNANRKDSLIRPRLDRILRDGLPHVRKGRNVSSEEFKAAFGFADVVIGEYVTAQQGQDHLNYAYDAMMTLAHVLETKPANLSFGGRLYFTIGALGHGKYAAHFSPAHPVTINGRETTVPVINVTATRGDGSVLHEYFHAIDYLSTDPRLKSAIAGIKRLLQSKPGNPDDVLKIAEDFLSGWRRFTRMGRSTPKESALYALNTYFPRDSKRTKTNFYSEALILDKGSQKPYWSNDVEPFARMSEAWGYDTLINSKRRDDYLVSNWVQDGFAQRPKHRGAPYPMEKERERLVALFQRFADNLAWSKDGPSLKADSPWQYVNPWQEAEQPYLDALKNAADNIDAIEASRKEKEAQTKIDAENAKAEAVFGPAEEPAAEEVEAPDEAPPVEGNAPVADNVGMSEDELSAIFDEESDALREETQEIPEAPQPGEKVVAPKTTATREDLEYLLAEVEAGRVVLLASNDLGLPTIHDMPSGSTEHMGYGTFKTETTDYTAVWEGGSAMGSTPGGLPYTGVTVKRGTLPLELFNPEAIKTRLKAALLPRGGPRAAPSLSSEQDKTAAALAKEMAKHGVTGIDEALKGLVSIFGGGPGKLQSFPGGFDEDSYNAAKPHFAAAAEAFGKAGMAFKEFVRVFFRHLIGQFGDGVKPYAVRFAKDYEAEFLAKQQAESPVADDQEAQDTPATADNSPSAKLAGWVKTQLENDAPFDWRALFRKADWFFGGTQANGMYSVKDAYDAMELGINQHLLDNKYVYDPTDNARSARDTITDLAAMLQNVVTQTKRTAEMDEFQQFSTPPHYAYLANWVANLNKSDVYLEPSAGIGGLATFAKVAGVREVIVNELSDRRLAVLRNLPFDRFFSENAEQLNNVLPGEIQPTVIVMNPPFSATAGRQQGSRDTMNGAKHIEQALKRLNPGGRLVAIVGEGMAADRPAFRDWWKKVMAEYNVRANVGIEGAGYVKYGTTFDNQILVIDKTGPTSGEVVTAKVKSPADAIDLLENVRATRPDAANDQDTTRLDSQAPGQPGSGATDSPGADAATGSNSSTAGPSDLGGRDGASNGTGHNGGRDNAVKSDATGAERPLGGRRNGAAESGRPGKRGAKGADGTGNAEAGSRSDAVDGKVELSSSGESGASGEITNSVFEQYTPKKVRVAGAVAHNTPLVESSALASVVPPDPSYAPRLPPKVVKEGLLSDAQLEAVVYAGQAHQQTLNDGKTRRGFFLGDGTGVGKGRQISGVIMDNWNQGRKKAIWISKKKELIADAKRDFSDLGGDSSLLFDLGSKKIGESITAGQGIMFAGYPTIRGQTKAARDAVKANKGNRNSQNGISYERVQQIVDWVGADFDGVLVFDEAHEMGNAVPIKGKRGTGKASDQALAGLELQRALPKARVMYVSATGATEVSNLAYAERLGIWGDGTPFANVNSFVSEMSRSVSAMELVAQNLKQMGLYLARSLSFEGVQYTKLEHQLTDDQKQTYDMLAGAWQMVLKNIDAALETTGVMDGGKASGGGAGKIKSAVMSAFWGSHQRFFNQIITASQMPSVIKQMERDLADGKSLVLQLTSTNEADQNRALAKVGSKSENEGADTDSLEELDLTPRDQIINLVANAFPVIQYESFTPEGEDTPSLRPVKDASGNVVRNKEAEAQRDALIEELSRFEVPDSPLQMIMDVFGADKVAEITGRTQRVETDKKGKRHTVKRGAASVAADSQAFKDGKKRILIFSQAGGTGFSFHADRRYKNTQQRVHYVLQPGWSADKAVQGFGRSHRTNQLSAPIYRLISTDIPAQKRFISSIARRLEQLGALTAGQRDTAGGSMFSATDNLESKYATQAVRQFFEALMPGMSIDGVPSDILDQMGLTGVYDEVGKLVEGNIPPVTKFLNRMLSMRFDAQVGVFDFFINALEMQIDVARRSGAFDDGMQTVKHEGAVSRSEQQVYSDPTTGAETKYHEIEYQQKNPIYPFASADIVIKSAKQGGWFHNKQSGRIAGVWATNQVRTDKQGVIHKVYGIARTSGTTYENQDSFKVDSWDKMTGAAAQKIWEAENAKRPNTVSRRLHMVVGGILPIWDRFNNENVSVVRIGLDDGNRLLGRQIMDKDIADTMVRLSVESSVSKMSGGELVSVVLDGGTVEMSNRIKLKPVNVSGEKRVEIDRGARWFDATDERNLRDAGVITERIQYQTRYFIPSSATVGGPVLDSIMRVMGMNAVSVSNNNPEEQEGAGNIVGKDTIKPADKAIYGMAAEGKSAKDILKFIAASSRNPFYRQVARLLLKTGINPAVGLGNAAGWKFNAGSDNRYAAAYNPKTDAVELFRPSAAERNMLHELMHAATIKALAGKGLAAAQMRALFNHVKSTGKLHGLYGMSDIDEFVAEVFSNPKFQEALKAVGAPSGSTGLKGAWEWFVRIVGGILGLKKGYHNALSAALEIGVGVMHENMKLSEGKNLTTKGGNNSQFSPDNNDIRYNLTEQACNQLFDLLHTDNKFNALHKTIATQYHKSTLDKDFKRVFDVGQKFLLDNSRFAMDAADRAPSLLQKLGSLADVFKKGPKRADIEAIAAPIFTGTLDKVVYTDAQLRSVHNLSDPQIALYRECRAGINKSLDDLGASEMARIAKPLLSPAVIDAAKSATDFDTATSILHEALLAHAREAMSQADRARESGDDAAAKKLDANALEAEKTADDVLKKAGRIRQLKQEGYAPLMRFGNYVVDVTKTGEDGEVERIYFGMYETQRDANMAARAFRAEYPDANVEQGTMDTESWKLFGGVDPSSLEVFADAVGADESPIFQEYLRLTLNNRSALKRLIKREGIAGFSKDVTRVLSQFVTSNARLSSKNYHFGDMKKAVMDIPKMKGDVKNEAAKLATYLQNPNEEAAGLRGYLFIHYLGGSIASALTNMTQPITMTLPYLAQFGGAARAGAALVKAGKLYASGNYDAELAEAMALAEREGITAPHEIHQLYAESERGLGRNIWVRKGLRAWGAMFSLAESYNRNLTFISAFNMARANGHENPFAFAQTAVEDTQGIYNKGNRPDWARGTIGATVFTFKQFSISYIEFLSRLYKNDKKAFALAMAIMFMGAGAEGWPFAEDVEDLIDTIGQLFGHSTNSKQWVRQQARQVFGDAMGEFVRKGASAIPGIPIDISGRIGVSNLIPGTAMFKVSETDKSRDVFDFIGPVGGLAQSAVSGFDSLRKGDAGAAVMLAAPLAIHNIAKGADMLHYGAYRDRGGRKVVDTTPVEAFGKAIGFHPNTVAKESGKVRELQQSVNQQRRIKDEIADKWAAGIFDKDQEAIREAQAELMAWNLKNPESRIGIAPQQISTRLQAMHSTREQRFIKSAPKEIRGQVLKELRN